MSCEQTADVGVDVVRRVVDLIDAGVPLCHIRAALDRSADVYDLAMLVGLIEEMTAMDADVEPAF